MLNKEKSCTSPCIVGARLYKKMHTYGLYNSGIPHQFIEKDLFLHNPSGLFQGIAACGFLRIPPCWALRLSQLSGARCRAGLCTCPWMFQWGPPVFRVPHAYNEIPAPPLTSWGPSPPLRQAHFLPMSSGQLEKYMDVTYVRHAA